MTNLMQNERCDALVLIGFFVRIVLLTILVGKISAATT
jgi:hypothetical protein